MERKQKTNPASLSKELQRIDEVFSVFQIDGVVRQRCALPNDAVADDVDVQERIDAIGNAVQSFLDEYDWILEGKTEVQRRMKRIGKMRRKLKEEQGWIDDNQGKRAENSFNSAAEKTKSLIREILDENPVVVADAERALAVIIPACAAFARSLLDLINTAIEHYDAQREQALEKWRFTVDVQEDGTEEWMTAEVPRVIGADRSGISLRMPGGSEQYIPHNSVWCEADPKPIAVAKNFFRKEYNDAISRKMRELRSTIVRILIDHAQSPTGKQNLSQFLRGYDAFCRCVHMIDASGASTHQRVDAMCNMESMLKQDSSTVNRFVIIGWQLACENMTQNYCDDIPFPIPYLAETPVIMGTVQTASKVLYFKKNTDADDRNITAAKIIKSTAEAAIHQFVNEVSRLLHNGLGCSETETETIGDRFCQDCCRDLCTELARRDDLMIQQRSMTKEEEIGLRQELIHFYLSQDGKEQPSLRARAILAVVASYHCSEIIRLCGGKPDEDIHSESDSADEPDEFLSSNPIIVSPSVRVEAISVETHERDAHATTAETAVLPPPVEQSGRAPSISP